MIPSLKKIESFNVHGTSCRTRNIEEFNPNTAKIPQLWQQFHASDLEKNAAIYGVYSDYESDVNGLYTLTVGVKNSEFATVNVQSGNYLVFESEGAMPQAVIETWQAIWNYFETNNTHQRSYKTDFELYEKENSIAIYIGVKS